VCTQHVDLKSQTVLPKYDMCVDSFLLIDSKFFLSVYTNAYDYRHYLFMTINKHNLNDSTQL
jgi:hypothetical protein